MFFTVLKLVMLVISISIDSFFITFSYQASRIRTPFSSLLFINFICVGTFGIAIFLGSLFQHIISPFFLNIISFLILFSLGFIKIVESRIKKFYQNKEIHFCFHDVSVILNIYVHPEKADLDCSKEISISEAIRLGLALSLDSMAVGLGIGFMDVQFWLLIIIAFVLGLVLLLLGSLFGRLLSSKTDKDFSWVSGIILIFIAFFKLS